MTDREKLVKKIQALLAMTKENGASEAEALMAAQKARELMDEHDIELTETQVRQSKVMREEFMTEGRYHTSVNRLLITAVGKFTDTQLWWQNRSGGRGMGSMTYMTVVGQPADVKFAIWLMDMLSGYIMRGVEAHTGPQRTKLAFAQGAAVRISERLEEAARMRKQSASRALVLAKDHMIADWLKEQKIRLQDTAINMAQDYKAYVKGRAHGEGAQWAKPLEEGDEQEKIAS